MTLSHNFKYKFFPLFFILTSLPSPTLLQHFIPIVPSIRYFNTWRPQIDMQTSPPSTPHYNKVGFFQWSKSLKSVLKKKNLEKKLFSEFNRPLITFKIYTVKNEISTTFVALKTSAQSFIDDCTLAKIINNQGLKYLKVQPLKTKVI